MLNVNILENVVTIKIEQQHRATKAKQANVTANLCNRHQLAGCPAISTSGSRGAFRKDYIYNCKL